MIEDFLEGNKKFVETDFKQKIEHYAALSRGQSPKALWIACSDSRVDPERITSADMGDIFVHRNIGNLVPGNDLNIATVLEYAVNHLKVKDIVVCGHSNCGAMKAMVSESSSGDRFIPGWLENAKAVLDDVDSSIGPAEKMKAIEIANINRQLKNLKGYYMVSEAIERGDLEIHGIYYDLETGLLEKIA
ncbi:MAG: carbonic anhydrase [Methanomicrobiaceae archaeon]|nr:carbonic anhydrase [Methanomicrobiaceae archaeon]